MLRIGVDVGGTNTDAVLMDGRKLLAQFKAPTSASVTGGVVHAIQAVLALGGRPSSDVRAVMIGTTHFTNALVERRQLQDVGIVRLAAPTGGAVQPCLDWPSDLRNVLGRHVFVARGGCEYNGRPIAVMEEKCVREIGRAMLDRGLKAVAVSSVFSTVNPSMELRAAEILRDEMGDVGITLSHQIGRIGFLERENATILNASLRDVARRMISNLGVALAELKLSAPFFISQNDGTLMSADQARSFPVHTIASGPTNSLRGAAYLAGIRDGIVVDIGGTTTDLGVLSQGFPRESSIAAEIGGVRTNFRMPDILSLGLGGGSIVRVRADGDVTIGPDSVGHLLKHKALVFGGNTLTVTDIAVAAGHADIGQSAYVSNLSSAVIATVVRKIGEMLDDAVDRIKTGAGTLPVLLVGGGAGLVDPATRARAGYQVSEHAGVANAIGAAMSQVSAEVDRTFDCAGGRREAVLGEMKHEAIALAIASGADPDSVSILDIEESSMSYLPGGGTRVRIKAVGDLDLNAGHAP